MTDIDKAKLLNWLEDSGVGWFYSNKRTYNTYAKLIELIKRGEFDKKEDDNKCQQ